MITYLAPFSIAFILVSTQKTPKYYSYLAKEIGFSRLNEFRYIFLPISLPAITSVLILNILFSLNETSRTYILGNYYDPISLKILGTLNSGANGFTYSIGIFFIIITIILIIPVLMLLKNKSTPQIN
jgi:ABC-type spermidine/putrescine transport system permease subunit II